VVLTFVSATLPPAPSSFEHLLVVPLGVGVDNRTGVIPRDFHHGPYRLVGHIGDLLIDRFHHSTPFWESREKLFILLRFSHVKNL
jgi:hypothetical protein